MLLLINNLYNDQIQGKPSFLIVFIPSLIECFACSYSQGSKGPRKNMNNVSGGGGRRYNGGGGGGYSQHSNSPQTHDRHDNDHQMNDNSPNDVYSPESS